MDVQLVAREWVPSVWQQVEPLFERVIEHAQGELTLSAIQTMLCTGQWLLLVVVDGATIHGAAAVSVFNRHNSRVAFIHAVGGKGIATLDTLAHLKRVCAQQGATEIEGAVRKSIGRLWRRLGLREKYTMVGVAI